MSVDFSVIYGKNQEGWGLNLFTNRKCVYECKIVLNFKFVKLVIKKLCPSKQKVNGL